MIEVEGMINNRPFIILIDSEASHSYVDLRVVEICIYQEVNMKSLG
jgi:hypothetical protein